MPFLPENWEFYCLSSKMTYQLRKIFQVLFCNLKRTKIIANSCCWLRYTKIQIHKQTNYPLEIFNEKQIILTNIPLTSPTLSPMRMMKIWIHAQIMLNFIQKSNFILNFTQFFTTVTGFKLIHNINSFKSQFLVEFTQI